MQEEKDSRTLWVGNLNAKVTKKLLYELFLQAGPLEYVALPDKKPYAFVVFKHRVSVPYTIELMRGIRMFGDELKLKEKNTPVSGGARKRNYSPAENRANYHDNDERHTPDRRHRNNGNGDGSNDYEQHFDDYPPEKRRMMRPVYHQQQQHRQRHQMVDLQQQLYNQQMVAQREIQMQALRMMSQQPGMHRSYSSPGNFHEHNMDHPGRNRYSGGRGGRHNKW